MKDLKLFEDDFWQEWKAMKSDNSPTEGLVHFRSSTKIIKSDGTNTYVRGKQQEYSAGEWQEKEFEATFKGNLLKGALKKFLS